MPGMWRASLDLARHPNIASIFRKSKEQSNLDDRNFRNVHEQIHLLFEVVSSASYYRQAQRSPISATARIRCYQQVLSPHTSYT